MSTNVHVEWKEPTFTYRIYVSCKKGSSGEEIVRNILQDDLVQKYSICCDMVGQIVMF